LPKWMSAIHFTWQCSTRQGNPAKAVQLVWSMLYRASIVCSFAKYDVA